jgi:hypothetical protein
MPPRPSATTTTTTAHNPQHTKFALRPVPSPLPAQSSGPQIQYLSGRSAYYWHQDVRWGEHWDFVIFIYRSPSTCTREHALVVLYCVVVLCCIVL